MLFKTSISLKFKGYHDKMSIEIYIHDKMTLFSEWSIFLFFPTLQLLQKNPAKRNILHSEINVIYIHKHKLSSSESSRPPTFRILPKLYADDDSFKRASRKNRHGKGRVKVLSIYM